MVGQLLPAGATRSTVPSVPQAETWNGICMSKRQVKQRERANGQNDLEQRANPAGEKLRGP
eukprot:6429173-Amphidinium_carterae.1